MPLTHWIIRYVHTVVETPAHKPKLSHGALLLGIQWGKAVLHVVRDTEHYLQGTGEGGEQKSNQTDLTRHEMIVRVGSNMLRVSDEMVSYIGMPSNFSIVHSYA